MKRKVIEITKYGPATILKVEEDTSELKALSDKEVLVEVHFSGINFADIIMRLGLYRDAPPKPFIPGYEVSGIIKEVGLQVSKFKVGDKVMAGTRFGGYVSHLVLSEEHVYPLPEGFSLEEGAAFPVNFLTSYIALQEFGRVRSNDKILIENATGGVGVIGMQMAKSFGAQVVGLTTTPSKKEFIETYGAKAFTVDEFIRSDEQDFDFILSSSGGNKLKEQYRRLKKSGKLVCIGVQGAVKKGKSNPLMMLKEAISAPIYSILKLTMDSKMMGGFNALKYFDDEEWIKHAMKDISSGSYRPYIGKVFKAQDVAEAHECLENKKTRGKVLLSWVHDQK